MDDKSIEVFKKALEDGEERDYNIRILVVGPSGVGKTSVTKRLLRQDTDINEINSTNGIDVHVGKCKVSLKTLEWTVDPADTMDDNTKRLAKILENTSNSDTDEPICQTLEDNDSNDADDQEKIRTTKSDGEETAKQNQNSANAMTNDSDTALADPDSEACLNGGNAMNNQQEQDALLRKDLQEIVKVGGICADDDNATVSIWDFGGQLVFYTTHQMFLSHRAIYILVSNLSQHMGDLVMDDEPYFDCSGTKSLKIEEFFDIWINSIHGHSNCDRPEEPPVLLVGTHADILRPDQREEQIEAMFDAIRNRFAGNDASWHFTDKDFGLSNVGEDPKFNDLRQKIIEVAKQQSYWGELKPAKWIPLEKLLEDERNRGVEIISRKTVEQLNRKLPVPILSEEELDLFLRFQHEVAHIMYFSLPELRNKIVLSPQFLVNALKSLITADKFCKKMPEVLDSLKDFRQKGLLTTKLLDVLWKRNENTRFEENRDHILVLMEHLNIIARPINYAENDEDGDYSSTQEQDYFLVPCMLKEPPPHSVFQSEKSFISTPCLCLKLDKIAFLSAIFNRLLVACISRWPVATLNKKYLLYCGCGQFDVAEQHRLTLSFSSNIIGLKIVRHCKTDRHPSGTVCKDVYKIVQETLRKIGAGLSLVINYEECVKCPLGREDSFECLHSVDKVRNSLGGEFPCYDHDHVETFYSCDLLKYWLDSEELDQKLFESRHSLPSPILDRIPTDRELVKVSEGIGKEFQQLGLVLGVPQSRIDQIRGSNPYNMADQIIQMFMEWRKRRGCDATFRELEEAMIKVGIDTKTALKVIRL